MMHNTAFLLQYGQHNVMREIVYVGRRYNSIFTQNLQRIAKMLKINIFL